MATELENRARRILNEVMDHFPDPGDEYTLLHWFKTAADEGMKEIKATVLENMKETGEKSEDYPAVLFTYSKAYESDLLNTAFLKEKYPKEKHPKYWKVSNTAETVAAKVK